MAVLTPDTINSSILPNFSRKLRDNFFTSTVALEYLLNCISPVDGGLYIVEEILYNQNPNANVFAGGVAQLPASFVGNTTQATFNPIYYFGSVAIPDSVTILNKSEGEIIDVIAAQYEHMLMSLAEVLGNDVYGDATPRSGIPTLSGLGAVNTSGSDPGGGPYGGISRSGSSGSFKAPVGNAPFWNANVLTINGGAQTVWKGTVNPGSVTTMSFGALFALMMACTIGQYRPKILLTDLIGYQAYANVVQQTVRQSALEPVMKQGMSGLSFADIPMFQDDKCPSGSVYAVNDLFVLRPWRDGFFVVTPWRQPSNALVNIKYLLLVCNLVHTRPNTMGVMTGITG